MVNLAVQTLVIKSACEANIQTVTTMRKDEYFFEKHSISLSGCPIENLSISDSALINDDTTAQTCGRMLLKKNSHE